MPEKNRRRLVKIGLGITAACSVTSLPDRWQKPVVNAVLLPTHAQTSVPPATLSGGLFAVNVDLRAESGGSPEPAIVSLNVRSCAATGATVSVDATATLSPSGSVDLGSYNYLHTAPTMTTVIDVDASIFAPAANVTAIQLTFSSTAMTVNTSTTGALLTDVLTGSTTGFLC